MSELIDIEDLIGSTLGATTGKSARELLDQEFTAHRQFPGAWPKETLTINGSGAIAPAHAFVVVGSSGGISAVTTANTHDGMELKLVAGEGFSVTVKHGPDDEAGISLLGGADITLPTDRYITLKRNGDRWDEISPSVGATAAEVEIPTGSQTQAGILRLATDSELTVENASNPPTAGQLASVYTRTSTLEGKVTTLEGVSDSALEMAGNALSTANSANSAAIAAGATASSASKAAGTAQETANNTADTVLQHAILLSTLETSMGDIPSALEAIIGEAI